MQHNHYFATIILGLKSAQTTTSERSGYLFTRLPHRAHLQHLHLSDTLIYTFFTSTETLQRGKAVISLPTCPKVSRCDRLRDSRPTPASSSLPSHPNCYCNPQLLITPSFSTSTLTPSASKSTKSDAQRTGSFLCDCIDTHQLQHLPLSLARIVYVNGRRFVNERSNALYCPPQLSSLCTLAFRHHMDDDMFDDSSSGYSYMSYYSAYPPRSGQPTPPRPDPITHYDVRYIDDVSMRTGKAM